MNSSKCYITSILLFPIQRFWPGTFKLHVRDGDKSNGNDGCDPQEALKPMATSTMRIQLRDKQVAVYVNGAQVCTAVRQDRAVYKKAIVYAADPYVFTLIHVLKVKSGFTCSVSINIVAVCSQAVVIQQFGVEHVHYVLTF